MSSMGDVFHTFPALTDAMKALPNLKVDWVVEEGFAEIPAWHPVVDKVYPIGLRRWRKHPLQARDEMRQFFEGINQQNYDLVLDAQGLLKSAWVARKISAPKMGKAGMDWSTVRESLASLFYDQKIHVPKNQHAITRLRQLFAQALKYPMPDLEQITYGLNTQAWKKLPNLQENYLVFLHGTTWDTKLWPEDHWQALLEKVTQKGHQVVIPWGNKTEKQRAIRIAGKNAQAWVPEAKLSLNEMARILKFAQQVVSVDTGLSHVSAALDTPMVVLYRVTDPIKVGALGKNVIHLVSPMATEYIKKFKNFRQKTLSLQGLEVKDVIQRIEA